MRLAPGQTVSHYRILGVLGEGGMGIVYRAQDLKLPREVALKFLPDELVRNSEAKKRFVNEAKTASSLEHPNICTIFDVDETSDDRTFIVMPCYSGETLRRRLERGPLGVNEAVDITCQVASGLARAHEKSIVHRDIKPENIFVTDNGTAVVMDFGLAKLAGSTKLTRTGKTMGTVAYMSPEQATGGDVDHRSDMFSLGAVLYEMLTGRRPFKGEHDAAILFGIVHSEPDPVSAYREDVPAALPAIVEKTLKKNPDERYQSAIALKNDLARVVGSGESKSTRSFVAAIRSRRALVGLSALLVIAAIVAIAWKQWIRPVEAEEQALAIIDFRALAGSDDDGSFVGITELVNVGLIEASPVRLISTEYLQDLRRRRFGASGAIADDQALEVARESGATLLLAGSIGKSGDEPFVTWRLVDVHRGTNLAASTVRGADLARVADQIVAGALALMNDRVGVDAAKPARPVSEMTTESPEAYQYYLAGLQAARDRRDKAGIDAFEKATTLDSTFALAYFELSRLQRYNNLQAAQASAHRAWEKRSRLGIRDRFRLEGWRESLANNAPRAIETYRELVDRWPEDREALRDLAWVLFYYWHWDESARVAERGLSLYPDELEFLSTLSITACYSGRIDEALRLQQRLVARDPTNPNEWDNLGLTYLALGLPDSAETAFRKALAIDNTFLWSQLSLTWAAYCAGHTKKAIAGTAEILRRPDLTPAERLMIRAGRHFDMSLAFFHAECGQLAKALEISGDALADPTRGTGDIGAILTMTSHQELLLATGDRSGAIAWGQRIQRYRADPYVSGVASLSTLALYIKLDSLTAARASLDSINNPSLFQEYPPLKRRFLFRKAELLLREGHPDSALAYLDELGTSRPFICPSVMTIEHRHLMAQALRELGRPGDAIDVLRELLRLFGGHALGHYELGKLYEEIEQPAEARREYAKFLEMWAEADEGLPQLIHARERLKALGV